MTPSTSRIVQYVAVGFGLAFGYLLLRGSMWQGSATLHTVMESLATLLACFVGIMALVRYYSMKDGIFLFLGAGFLGTGFLDGYHALVTSAYLEPLIPSDLPALIPWSWVASRLFLSVMMVLSWLAWHREQRLGKLGRFSERHVYIFTALFTVACFLFFAFAPLPRAYYPEIIFHRPEEFGPALFFLIALAGYLHKGHWRRDPFEHWLVLSLIVGFVSQAVFMSYSGQLFDFEFDAAHALKKISYVCVLSGLLLNTYATFRREADTARELDFQRRALDEHAILSITDVSGAITYANDQFCQISGYSRQELLGQNHRILKSGQHPKEFYADLWKTIVNGKSWHGEVKNRTKSGGSYWVRATIVPFLDDQGKPFRYVAIRTDITERKEAEESLKRQSERVEFMQHLARIANEAKTLRQGVEATISRVCDFTGWDLGHAYLPEGEDLSVLLPSGIWVVKGHAQGRFDAFMERTQQGRLRIGEGLFDTILKDGKPVIIADVTRSEKYSRREAAIACGLHGAFALAIMAGNQVIGVLEFYSLREGLLPEDVKASLAGIGIQLGRVAERTRMLERLERVAHEAQQANRAKSEFLSTMSHELRTPMNAILGFGQMLEYNPKEPLTEEQQNCVDHIMAGGRHLLELIDQVLDLAKIEAGKLSISVEEVVLDEACRECLKLIGKSALDRDLNVESDLGATHNIKADHTRFKQILLNLLSNAVKYNRRGGNITLVSEDAPDNMVRISVSDTGSGISEDEQAGLFEPFNRLGREASEIEGTGVGLTITKKLVEAMDGHIDFESEIGKGSTFRVVLPAIEAAPDKQAERVDVSEIQERQKQSSNAATILYIEDNPANQQLMEAIIDRMGGISLMTAHNAELGMSMAEERKPDLILMDINLPGMDGISAKQVLSTIEATKDIPVIAITAAAMKTDIKRGMAAGFKAYLTKPFNVPEIIAVIKRELG